VCSLSSAILLGFVGGQLRFAAQPQPRRSSPQSRRRACHHPSRACLPSLPSRLESWPLARTCMPHSRLRPSVLPCSRVQAQPLYCNAASYALQSPADKQRSVVAAAAPPGDVGNRTNPTIFKWWAGDAAAQAFTNPAGWGLVERWGGGARLAGGNRFVSLCLAFRGCMLPSCRECVAEGKRRSTRLRGTCEQSKCPITDTRVGARRPSVPPAHCLGHTRPRRLWPSTSSCHCAVSYRWRVPLET
jgi:hypothetical protein